MKARGKIYVMVGEGPDDWSGREPLGPFESQREAREAIEADVAETIEDCDSLRPGRLEQWCERYTVLQEVRAYQPRLDVGVKVTMRTALSA